MKKVSLILLITSLILTVHVKAQFSNDLFRTTDTTICIGDSLGFTALYPNMKCYDYVWDLGGGVTSADKSQFGYRFQQAGTYQLRMEMKGDSILRRIRSIKVHRVPSGWSEWPFDKLTKPDLYLIIRDSCGRGLRTTTKGNINLSLPHTFHMTVPVCDQLTRIYAWEYDNIGAHDYLGDVNFRPRDSSYYLTNGSLQMTVYMDTLKLTPQFMNITVLQPLQLAPVDTSGPLAFCTGDHVQLSVPGLSPNMTFQWYKNGNAIYQANDSTLSVTTAGDYYLEARDSSSCGRSNHVQVTVHANPTNVVDQTPAGQWHCFGDSIQLKSRVTRAYYSYQWMKDGQPLNGAIDENTFATHTGVYHLVIKDTATLCATTSASRIIKIVTPYQSSISMIGPTTFCQNSATMLLGNTGTGFIYQWYADSIDIPTGKKSSLKPSFTGLYQLAITDSAGCYGDTSSGIAIQVLPPPLAPTIQAPGNKICKGDSLSITTQLQPGLQYQWLRDNFPYSSISDSMIWVKTLGNYAVQVTDSQGCSNRSPAIGVQVHALPIPTISHNGDDLVSSPAFRYQWYYNAAPLQTATQQVLTFPYSGWYKVWVENEQGCGGFSDSVLVRVTGLEEDEFANAITLFPNPASDICYLQITSDQHEDMVLTWIDQNGKTIKRQEESLFSGEQEIPLFVDGLANGMYYIQVRIGERMATKKLIVRK